MGPITPETVGKDREGHDPDNAGLVKLGPGACRGTGWQGVTSKWPTEVGIATVSQCGEACGKMQGCTSFDLRESNEENENSKRSKFICTLYGHENVIPASAVRANCYAAPREGFTYTPHKTQKDNSKDKASAPKVYKIPKFKEPKVVHDEELVSEDDDEWLFEPPPPEIRSRDHIDEILDLSAPSSSKIEDKHLKDLKKIYESSIKPLETAYKYKELSNRHFGDPEIFNKPLIVLMGPWSGGKSTMINYFLGTEYTKNAFRAGILLQTIHSNYSRRKGRLHFNPHAKVNYSNSSKIIVYFKRSCGTIPWFQL